jgi:hypothetical protein
VTTEVRDAAATGVKKHRSPAYPAVDLAEALQKAEALRKEAGRNEVHVEVAMGAMGFAPKSGWGMAVLSALLKYGLLDDEGKGETRKVKLTSLALEILLDDRPDSPERIERLKRAALLPAIHKEIWDRYQGALPGDGTLRVYLRRDRRFGDSAADEVTKVFRSTVAYARLGEPVSMSPATEDKNEFAGELTMTPPETITGQGVSEQQKNDHPTDNGTPRNAPSQRTNRTVQIPLTKAPSWALLQVPFPMTAEDWQELLEFLNLMESPLTGGQSSPDKRKKRQEPAQSA